MNAGHLIDITNKHLNHLCNTIKTRRLGKQGNQDATVYFHQQIQQFGFEIEQQRFDCIDSCLGPSTLKVDGNAFNIFASPFTQACVLTAQLVAASTLGGLESIDCKDKILLLHGDIAREQLMPKGFEFYNPEEHQKIYQLLERKEPAAILTATSKNPDAVGAIYPFPMIEDGDFNIPSAFLKDMEGLRLLPFMTKQASLTIDAARVPSSGENIVARKGNLNRKLVICAHIDTKENTPGALDNASGVTIMLLLGHLLVDYQGDLGIELVALNGEEYYNTPGQVKYLRSYQNDFSSILLAINMDDIGYINGRTAFSFYGVPESIMNAIRFVYAEKDGFFEGPPWYQSDHGIFMAKGIPAMAITEENVLELMAEITHTEKDVPTIIDPHKLVQNAQTLKSVIAALDQLLQ